MQYILRDYQERAVQDGIELLQSKTKAKGFIVIGTGGGKSLVIAEIAKRVGGKVLVLQPSKELLAQNYEKYKTYADNAAIYSASLKSKEIGYVTFATIGSIKNLAKKFKELGFKYVINDECFVGQTLISTEHGAKRIRILCDLIAKGKDVPRVHSYNEETSEIELKKITNGAYMGHKEVFELSLNGGKKIKATTNHKFLTTNGWVELGNLRQGDCIITSFKEENTNAFVYPTECQRQIILGSILGDGHMHYPSKKKLNGRLRLIHGEDQLDYLKWKNSFLGNNKIQKIEKNGYAGKPAYRFTTKQIAFTKPSYKQVMDEIDLLGLAILWMDDGHMDKLQRSGTLYTFSTMPNEIEYLRDTILRKTGANAVISKSKGKFNYLRFRKGDLELLTSAISEYIPECMHYKIPSKFRKQVTLKPEYNKYKVNVVEDILSAGKEDVYDIEVEDNHNFLVSTTGTPFGGVIAHNCHLGCKPGSMVDKFLKAAGITNVLGLTATPVIMKTYMGVTMWKMLNRTRESIFSKLVHVTQISHLVENGFWAEIVYEVVSIDPTKYKLNTVGSDYTFESMRLGYSENAVEDKIIQTIHRLKNEGHKSVLIFVPTIDEAISLASIVDGCEYVSSQCKAAKRKKVVEGFKAGSIPYVVNCQILGTGFDFPELSAAILARPTMSLAVYYQQVGRICRPHPNKKYAKVVDISGNAPRLGRVEEIEFKEDRIYGWQMYCGGIQMTNVPLPEIGSEKLAPVVEIHYSAEKDLVFDFGRFKGKHLRTIPNWYLDWMLKSYNFKSQVGFRKSIREEVQRREKYNIYIR